MKAPVLLVYISGLFTIFSCGTDRVKCDSNDIEQIDSCLIGKTIEFAINQLQTDSSHFRPHLIFYRELHGIYINALGPSLVTLVIEKPLILSDKQMEIGNRSYYRYILDSKIKGVCWRKEKEKKIKTVGNVNYAGCRKW